MTTTSNAIWIGCALALTGCGKSDSAKDNSKAQEPGGTPTAEKSPVPPKPLEVEWNEKYGTYDFTVVGGGGTGHVHASDDSVNVRLEGFAKGTKYVAGDVTGTLDDAYGKYVEVSVRDKLGGLTWDSIKKVDTGVVVKLTLPDGRQGEAVVPPISFQLALRDVFGKHIENGPVTFGTEPEDAKPEDSLVLVAGSELKIIGRAGKLTEIDFVATYAINEDEEKGRKTCSGYKDNSGKAMPDLILVLRETEATVWNRRTGEVVEQKRFPPDDHCPMMTFRSGDDPTHDSYPPTTKIEAWVKTKIKR